MQSPRPLRLYKVSCEAPLCHAVQIAGTLWLRLRGLLGRPELQPGTGLLLLPSNGIHTFGMRYAIDAVLLDQQFRVLLVHENVPPRRIRLADRKTHCVLELRGGEARRIGLAPGDCLRFEEPSHPAAGQSAGLIASLTNAGRLPVWVKLLLAMLLCLQGALCWSTRTTSLNGQVDLRAYYSAGAMARAGAIRSIYDDAAEQRVQQAIFHHDGWRTLHFLYPPFAVLPYVPLSLLPYRTAFFVVLAGNLGCLFFCAWLLVREHPEWRLSAGVLSLFFLCYFPTADTLIQGQISFVLLLAVTMLYRFERRGQPLLAGLCLAVGLAKFQVVLPVALLYLLWRRYRVVAGFALGASALLLLSLLLTGLAGLRAYAVRLGRLGTTTLLDQHAAHLHYGMQVAKDPNLHGLATLLAGNGTRGAMLTAALSLVVLLWSVRQKPSATIAVIAALLLSYHLQLYGLVLSLLPLTLLAMGLRSSVQEHWHAATKTRAATCLLGGSMVLLSPPLAYSLVLRGNIVWYVLASFATLTAAALSAAKPDREFAVPVAAGARILAEGTA